MRDISEIIIHCAATRPSWMEGRTTAEKVAEIRRWHVEENGWNDIGYHAVIDRDGTVIEGRDDSRAGAHCKGRNANSLGVCLIGGFGSNENDAFADHYTPEQDRALRSWIEGKKAKYDIKKITGHNEHSAKACPGFKVGRWLANKPPETANPASDPKILGKATTIIGGCAGTFTAASQLDGMTQLVLAVGGMVLLALGFWTFKQDIRDYVRGRRSA